ncbi:divalent-cation tolerance protein CutA [Bdellovibrio sp. HCB290]|uniref:divalent-cation tolerance protein CutA n=1 Tax=Bdellovibrio sp. HCB290 TaxID=3394356 RepID=UPI0039B6B738
MQIYYIPCPDKESAENIARTLLQEKLIGCANIIPGMSSMYWWEGKIESSQEVVLILKTIKGRDAGKNLQSRVQELHPYDVPCVMALNVASINDSFKNWLEQSLK